MEEVKKHAPNGVKVISILLILLILWLLSTLIVSIVFFSGSDAVYYSDFSRIINFSIWSLIFLGIIIFIGFISRGLWKGKNWARKGLIILTILLVIMLFVPLNNHWQIRDLEILIPLVIISLYLIFSKKIKEFFS